MADCAGTKTRAKSHVDVAGVEEISALRRHLPPFRDLRSFTTHLEAKGQLVRMSEPVSVVHEITEIHRRVLRDGGPALLFEAPIQPDGTPAAMPVLTNLFGTRERVAWGLGIEPGKLAEFGAHLAALREPSPPRDLADAMSKLPLARAALAMRPKTVGSPPAQEVVLRGDAIDLTASRPDLLARRAGAADHLAAGHHPPAGRRRRRATRNVGVYRMQVHRPRPRHHALARAPRRRARTITNGRRSAADMPVAVVIGADPATILSAVLPLPETCRKSVSPACCAAERPRMSPCVTVPLMVPADAEIVIEGDVSATRNGAGGALRRSHRLLQRGREFSGAAGHRDHHARDPIYLSTFTGRPPDEPSRIGEALNELFVPLVRTPAPRNRRSVAAAGGLLLSHRGRLDQQALSRPGAAASCWPVVDAAAVQLHQVPHRRRRRHQRARLGGRDVGGVDARGPLARSGDAGRHADRLSRFRLAANRVSAASSASTRPPRSARKRNGSGARRSPWIQP